MMKPKGRYHYGNGVMVGAPAATHAGGYTEKSSVKSSGVRFAQLFEKKLTSQNFELFTELFKKKVEHARSCPTFFRSVKTSLLGNF